MVDVILSIVLGIIIALIVGLINYARRNYGKLDNLGFPVIPPTFMLGSVPDIHLKVQHYEDIKRCEEHGLVWGLYQGRTPIVFFADADLIKEIFVKDSSYFFDREAFDFGNPIVNEILDFLPGEKWKTMRVSQTKLFSSGKIRHYSNQIFKDSMEAFVSTLDREILQTKNDRVCIDAREVFCTYTIDIIARSMLSMKVNPEENIRFYTACKRLIGDGQVISGFYIWTLVFPFLSHFEPTLILDPAMIQTFSSLLESRRLLNPNPNQPNKLDDYADVMLQLMGNLGSDHFHKLGITQNTIWGQAVNLFLAGFDRISTTMTFLAYHLAMDVEAQERLQAEIDGMEEEQGYESLGSLPYLNACISEVFRMYPVFIRPERVCTKDWISSCGKVRIPRGVTVQIASWAVNRNPKYYEDPHTFKPERFLAENKANLNPYAMSTFGFGHRNCIGMRFAYEAMRVGMFYLFKNYNVEVRDDTRVNFKKGIINSMILLCWIW